MVGDQDQLSFSLTYCDLNKYNSLFEDTYPYKSLREELLFYL